jgi:glutamine amidotransferase PdxT
MNWKTGITAGIAALGILVAASPVGAAPSNKNTESFGATCDNGKTITISTVHKNNETADSNSAGVIVGGGAAQAISITGFEPGTTHVIFTQTTHHGGPANATCAGTITEGGESFDFVAVVHLAGAN